MDLTEVSDTSFSRQIQQHVKLIQTMQTFVPPETHSHLPSLMLKEDDDVPQVN